MYLTKPFNSTPYSLIIKIPTQTKPFDLKTITIHIALNINPFTTQVTTISNPLPQFLKNIPITYHNLQINTNHPNFIINPTNYKPQQITSILTSTLKTTTTPSSQFQITEYESLTFKPTLKINLTNSTKQTNLPTLKTIITYPKKNTFTNITQTQINLPNSKFLEQNNLNKNYTHPILLKSKYPPSTIYKNTKTWTPLLKKPIQNPIYLINKFKYKLPTLITNLNDQIKVLLKNKINTSPNNNIQTTFETVPDTPINHFKLQIKNNKKYELLINSKNIYHNPQHTQTNH